MSQIAGRSPPSLPIPPFDLRPNSSLLNHPTSLLHTLFIMQSSPLAPGDPGSALATSLRKELDSGIGEAGGDREKEREFLDAFIRRVEKKEDALVAALRAVAPVLRDASHGSAGSTDVNAVIALASRYAYHTHGPVGWRPGLPMGPGFRPPAPQDVHMRLSSLFANGGALLPGGGEGAGTGGSSLVSPSSGGKNLTEQKEFLQVRSLKMPKEDILGAAWTGKVDFGLEGVGVGAGGGGGGGSGGVGVERTTAAGREGGEGEATETGVAMDVDQSGINDDADLPAMPAGWNPGDAIPDELLEAVGGDVPEMPAGWKPGDPIPGL